MMAKNMLKRNIGYPRNLKKDTMYLKHGYIWKSELDKIAVHFHTQSCKFYILLEQLPEYIIEDTRLYQETSKDILDRAYEGAKIMDESVSGLEKKIKALFEAYITESSKVTRCKKIAVFLKNYQIHLDANIGVEYQIFSEKTYYKHDGTIDKIVNVDINSNYETELKDIDGEIFDYSEELENNILALQKQMYDSMEVFIKTLGKGNGFISAIASHKKLIENKI
jgi:hypothetical protein